jgi:hypothetical protein
MFTNALVRIGCRGVILATALAVAAAGCSSSNSSSKTPVPASSAPAQTLSGKGICTTTISNQTVGNVFVPAQQGCTLNHVTVKGNITVYGTLQMTTSAAIGGNLIAEWASNLGISDPATVTVDGNVTLNGPARSIIPTLDHIGGNLTVDQTIDSDWTDTYIGGSVFFTHNGPGTVFGGNTVAGNISCSDNTTAPTNGGTPNKVRGHETGQCAHLH